MLTNTLHSQLKDFAQRAFLEDLSTDGDHTAKACIPADAIARARLLVKDKGILAGVEAAEFLIRYLIPNAKIDFLLRDGDAIQHGDIAFYLEAPAQLIVQIERTVLNTMQRMSGIATLTRQYVDLIADLPTRLLDTRKTTPTLRFLEKWAVRIGGGENYRDGLYDRIMIKDNHTDYCGNIIKAIEKVHKYLKTNNLDLPITVEVRNLEELEQVLSIGGIERIMLDNFDLATLAKAVERIDKKFQTEASGGVNLHTLRPIALTGVDYISVGALTHSFQSLDLSLKSSL